MLAFILRHSRFSNLAVLFATILTSASSGASTKKCTWDKKECDWRAEMDKLWGKTAAADAKKADAMYPGLSKWMKSNLEYDLV